MGFIFLLIIMAIYFLPTIIAGCMKKRNTVAIGVLNVFGFTGIAWVIAMVWACCSEEAVEYVEVENGKYRRYIK